MGVPNLHLAACVADEGSAEEMTKVTTAAASNFDESNG
jgi:hypothetical protein